MLPKLRSRMGTGGNARAGGPNSGVDRGQDRGTAGMRPPTRRAGPSVQRETALEPEGEDERVERRFPRGWFFGGGD